LLLAIGMFLVPVQAVRDNWDDPLSVFDVCFLVSSVGSLWLYGLQRRKRWLWWLTVILVALDLIDIALIVARFGTDKLPPVYYVQCAFLAPATVLLCLAPARNWFFRARGAP
jgi:hypothetical protein